MQYTTKYLIPRQPFDVFKNFLVLIYNIWGSKIYLLTNVKKLHREYTL